MTAVQWFEGSNEPVRSCFHGNLVDTCTNQVAKVSLDPSKREPAIKKVVTSKSDNQQKDSTTPVNNKPSQQVIVRNLLCIHNVRMLSMHTYVYHCL